MIGNGGASPGEAAWTAYGVASNATEMSISPSFIELTAISHEQANHSTPRAFHRSATPATGLHRALPATLLATTGIPISAK